MQCHTLYPSYISSHNSDGKLPTPSIEFDKMLMLESLEIPRMEILPCVDIHCCVFPIATDFMTRGVLNGIELVFGFDLFDLFGNRGRSALSHKRCRGI